MWIVKGLLLGTGFWVFGTFAFLFFVVLRPFRASHATGLTVLTGATVFNPLWWLALVGCLLLGVALIGSWPTPVKP